MPPQLPFRPFFVLAALDSMVGVGIWIPSLAGWGGFADATGQVSPWHARELLFGAFPALLSGFLLTALPRWTGRPFAPRPFGATLVALWLTGPASLFLFPAGRAVIAAGYLAVLACIVAYQIQAAGSRRNVKIAVLVALLASAAVIDLLAAPDTPDLALRLAIGVILGLVMVLGGRIIPSLTAVHLDLQGRSGLPSSSGAIELAAAATATLALGAWIWAPDTIWTACFGPAAAVGQAVRCARWRPWRVVNRPSAFALHGAYACVPAGFALASMASLAPETISGSIALHVWAVGAIGLISIAVMASMIRRHLGPSLRESPALTSAFGLLVAALAGRSAAEFIMPVRDLLLLGAAIAWISAHLLFLARFTNELLRRSARDPSQA